MITIYLFIKLRLPFMNVKKLLLVEDVQFNLLLLNSILEKLKVETISAENNRIAIEMLKTEQDIDFVLMDIETPELTGVEAIQIIRTEFPEPYSTIPIIAATAHFDEPYLRKLIEYGFNGYILKPVTLEKITDCLNSNESLITSYRDKLGLSTYGETTESVSYDVNKIKEWSGDDDTVMRELLSLFVAEAPKALSSMENCLQEKNWKCLREEAHRFSPQVGFLGIDSLVKTINELEKVALQVKDENIARKLFITIKNQSNELLEKIRSDFSF